MGKKLLGRATVRIDGKVYDTKKGTKLDLGGIKREPRPGSNTTGGFTEELVPSKLETTLLIGAGDSLAAINQISDATIMVEFDTGQTYVLRGGYCAETVSATEGEGEAALVFMAQAAQELM